MTRYPYRCPSCRRPTGFKRVSRSGAWLVGVWADPDREAVLRASCRFCGYIREGARA